MLAPTFVHLIALFALVAAVPSRKRATSCTVSSLDDASDLSDCSTVTIEGFTVPAGETLTMKFADGATVTVSKYPNLFHAELRDLTQYSQAGNVLFGNVSWDGPLVKMSTCRRRTGHICC